MNIKLLTEHHLEFLTLTGGCTGSSEPIYVKMPHCLKSHVAAHMYLFAYWVILHAFLLSVDFFNFFKKIF